MATLRSGRLDASRRPGLSEKCYARGAKWPLAASDGLARFGRQLVKLNQDFSIVRNRCQEEIDARAVGAGSGGGIDRGDFELFLQNLGGAVDIRAAKLYLLNAFSKLSKIAREHSRAAGGARGQHVQRDAFGKVQLEFFGVLVGGHFGQSRRAIGDANAPEG